MGPIGMQEMIVIFLVALVLFGPKKLPELGKNLAKAITEFRRAQSDLKATFEREMQALEKETESLKEATRQATVDLTNYPDIDLSGSSSSYDHQSSGQITSPTVSASAIPGAELHAELSAPQTPDHGYGSMENHPSEATMSLENHPSEATMDSHPSEAMAPTENHSYETTPTEAKPPYEATPSYEATPGVNGTVPRGTPDSTTPEVKVAASTVPEELNPLPEFVQTGGRGATHPADAELPSIV